MNQESYLLQTQACSLEQRHPIQHARGNVKCGKRSTPLTDQSNSRYRCQAQLPTITRQAPGPPVARSSCVSSPSAISGLAFWVKSSECPHISKESIGLDRAMWGEHSPQFRQKHLAEFTAEDEEAFISIETVRGDSPRVHDNPPLNP